MSFTEEEKKLLEKYVTSTESDIFAVRGMEGMVGAAYARYSRAKGGFREVLLNEFLKEGVIDPKHADQLIERILIAYGDDSVGELEGAHVSFENISVLSTKEIEDRRIGGSPIEQSTRYVFYDQKIKNPSQALSLRPGPSRDGSRGEGELVWRYLRHKSLTETVFGDQYIETMDFIFETYASLVEPMKEFYGKKKTLEQAEYDINGDGIKEKYGDLAEEKLQKAFRLTYNMDLRTKACDTLRCLLPLATLTNVGVFGNGRFFQYVISHLLTADLPEAHTIAEETHKATSQLIPQYVRRAKRNDYLVTVRQEMYKIARFDFDTNLPERPSILPYIELLEDAVSHDESTITAMVFPFTNISIGSLRKIIASMSGQQRQEIINAYIGDRKTRRDRPGRALEDGYPYTFEMVTNFGVYKDLERHRMNTQQRQLFTTKIGFETAQELVEAGFNDKVKLCLEKIEALYDSMAKTSKSLAQYAVLHGNYVRWSIGMNDREAMHMLELRTTPQGHSQYRKAAAIMHKLIARRSVWRANAMKFVDYNDYFWARGDAEARQRVKESKLDTAEQD